MALKIGFLFLSSSVINADYLFFSLPLVFCFFIFLNCFKLMAQIYLYALIYLYTLTYKLINSNLFNRNIILNNWKYQDKYILSSYHHMDWKFSLLMAKIFLFSWQMVMGRLLILWWTHDPIQILSDNLQYKEHSSVFRGCCEFHDEFWSLHQQIYLIML